MVSPHGWILCILIHTMSETFWVNLPETKVKSMMGFGMLVILGSLALSVYTAYAHDAVEESA